MAAGQRRRLVVDQPQAGEERLQVERIDCSWVVFGSAAVVVSLAGYPSR